MRNEGLLVWKTILSDQRLHILMMIVGWGEGRLVNESLEESL